MDITTVKQQIKNKEPQHFYVFTGEEVAVMDIYINKIAECINTKPIRAESIIDIMPRLSGTSFLNTAQVYVIREDTDFLKQEKSWQAFIDGSIQKNNIIILCYNSLDKRSKFYKQYNSILVEFTRLNEQILSKYALQKIKLSSNNLHTLIEVCEYDLSRIYLEIDKILAYGYSIEDKNEYGRYDRAFEKLLAAGVIYKPSYDAIFDFIKAFMKRDANTAFKLYQMCMDIAEPNMRILSVMHTTAKQVLQVQACQSSDIAKSTGLTGFQIHNAKELINHYSNRELVDMIRCIRKAEKGIKTGEIEDMMSVPYVMVNMLWSI